MSYLQSVALPASQYGGIRSSGRPSAYQYLIIVYCVFKMLALKHLVLAIFAFFTVAQCQQFQIQNWV